MPTAVETVNHTTSSVVSPSPSSSSPSTSSTSRRALRQTLNDALSIASDAVQLDTEGDYTRSMEAYQRSVDLLEEGIQMMRRQRDHRAERPGRDTSHEITQLEAIREKYKARIALHKRERSRKAAKEAAAAPEAITNQTLVSPPPVRRPRTPQSASTVIPPPPPPPSAPLPPLPPTPDSGNSMSSVLYLTRPRGTSLPSNQDNNDHYLQSQPPPPPQPQTQTQQRIQAQSKPPTQVPSQRYEPANAIVPPPAYPASIPPSGNDKATQSIQSVPPLSLKVPKSPPPATPLSASSTSIASFSTSAAAQTIQLDGFPAPKKKKKSSGRPQTAPGPSSASSPPAKVPAFLEFLGTSPITPPSTRSRTISGVSTSSVHAPPKRSNSSTALSSSMSSTLITPVTPSPLPIPGRLTSPIATGHGNGRSFHHPAQSSTHNLLSPSSLSPSALSKRTDLIPLQKLASKSDVPAFATIYGLTPIPRVVAPSPPPAPSDPSRHSYYLLKLVLGTLRPALTSPGAAQGASVSPTGTRNMGHGGGFLTPRLYVPNIIWHQPELWTLIADLPEKARQLEVLREALRALHEVSVILFGRVGFSPGVQGGFAVPGIAGAKISRTRSREQQSLHGHSSSIHSINSSTTAANPAGFDDPIAWLDGLEKLSNVLAEMQTSSSKKLGLGDPNATSKKTIEAGAAGYSTINGGKDSVTKKMMDWSTRVAKKAVGGGKGPSGELMEWYSDALGGVCALSAMLDGHLCALKSVLPSSSSGTTGPAATSGSATSPPSARRPTLSRGNTHETIGFGRMVSSSSLSSSQTAISTSSGTTTGSASVLIGASTLNLNNPLPPIPAPEFDPLFSSLSTSTPPPSKATTSNPSTTASDSSSEAIAQLVSQYTAFPKFVNTQALNHLEKITRVFAAFVCPLIMRDVAVLIQGLRSRTTADGGEWMGAML